MVQLDVTSDESVASALKTIAAETDHLNAVSVAFAKELAQTPIKVNAANPGYTATDLNAHSGHRTAEEGAKVAVQLATLSADGPTAGFFNDKRR